MRKVGVVVSIANLKGGVGKTTISVLFARFLALKGYRVLLIDADPQGTASYHAGEELFNEQGIPLKGLPYILKTLIEQDTREDRKLTPEFIEKHMHFISRPENEAFWLIPNSINSAIYDPLLQSTAKHFTAFRRILKVLPISVDVIIIDSPPYPNAFAFSALSTSDTLIIPAETTPQAFPGVGEMIKLISIYSDDGLFDIRSIVIIPTKVKRTKSSSASLKLLMDKYGSLIATTYIPHTEICNKVFSGILTMDHLVKVAMELPNSIERKIVNALTELEIKCVVPFVSEEVLSRLK